MLSNSKVAVIGIGNIGNAVVSNLVKGGRPVIIADRKPERSEELAAKLGKLAHPMTIPAAIKEADIVILAVWFNAVKEVIEKYSADLEGKIIIDPSNPIAPDDKGGFRKIIDEHQSAGVLNGSGLPKDTKLVKAFGTLSVGSLQNAAFREPERAVLFYTTDDANIKSAVEQLIEDTGFAPVHAGGIDQSIRIEVFGDLHEFGALGKTVTAPEAREKLPV